ncbi:AraC family transcriptional regulator [Pseudomonas aeruginosa]|uniref:AraC family transcriptional regulator n=1 Tax=Pseudomonas aeruginosa TaxID=287 RepID=UPI000F521B71|nr:AraC family transcriptional regulator [Pseudomonas aeruginosa]MCS7932115.1 AraC family transcriptional regulator [Pseudomonas aeruginosa]MCS8157954.1 AraC family transcriptional regulator [Pseudomonas aeruginosa]MCS8729022.1 AraC family transcriptional regulator [Pseudomonas aeruginosa]MCS9241252.1 AraC family transcriptional regulator [Pseudomonas aeruginosa]MCS9279274.1 AraC family transcriptional regulator [Pseudomonas aeruginosa]
MSASPPDSEAIRSADRQRMVALLENLAPQEGYNLTGLDSVRLLRSDRPLARTPVLYDPGIVIVCQGRKRGYFGEQIYLYDEQHYLAVAVPVPFTMETDATPERPLLAIYLHLDFPLAAGLAVEIDRQRALAQVEAPRSLMSSPMDAPLRASVLRFLEALGDPLETAILAPALLRELYFRVLTGPQGGAMRAALAMRGRFGNIARALRRIHAQYAEPLELAQLAGEAGMSVPSFHSHFKAITQTSPMQYLKCTRLHQARLLMVRQGMSAQAACHAVGYASASQFNREFKRLFGRSPLAEARRLRAGFSLPPAQGEAEYVSSH